MNDKMKSRRLVEMVLAGAAAAITVLSSVGLIRWLIEYVNLMPAASDILWLYLLIQAEWTISGLAGLAAVALDSNARSRYWGLLTWASVGGLIGAMLVAALSIVYFALPAAVLLSIAAGMADARRGRNKLSGPGLALAVAAASFLLPVALG